MPLRGIPGGQQHAEGGLRDSFKELDALSGGPSVTRGGADLSAKLKRSSSSNPGCGGGCGGSCCGGGGEVMSYALDGAECSGGGSGACCGCGRRHRMRRNGVLSIRRRRNGVLSIRRRRNGILAADEGQEGSWGGQAAKRPASSFARAPAQMNSLEGAGGQPCCCCACCRGCVVSDGGEGDDGEASIGTPSASVSGLGQHPGPSSGRGAVLAAKLGSAGPEAAPHAAAAAAAADLGRCGSGGSSPSTPLQQPSPPPQPPQQQPLGDRLQGEELTLQADGACLRVSTPRQPHQHHQCHRLLLTRQQQHQHQDRHHKDQQQGQQQQQQQQDSPDGPPRDVDALESPPPGPLGEYDMLERPKDSKPSPRREVRREDEQWSCPQASVRLLASDTCVPAVGLVAATGGGGIAVAGTAPPMHGAHASDLYGVPRSSLGSPVIRPYTLPGTSYSGRALGGPAAPLPPQQLQQQLHHHYQQQQLTLQPQQVRAEEGAQFTPVLARHGTAAAAAVAASTATAAAAPMGVAPARSSGGSSGIRAGDILRGAAGWDGAAAAAGKPQNSALATACANMARPVAQPPSNSTSSCHRKLMPSISLCEQFGQPDSGSALATAAAIAAGPATAAVGGSGGGGVLGGPVSRWVLGPTAMSAITSGPAGAAAGSNGRCAAAAAAPLGKSYKVPPRRARSLATLIVERHSTRVHPVRHLLTAAAIGGGGGLQAMTHGSMLLPLLHSPFQTTPVAAVEWGCCGGEPHKSSRSPSQSNGNSNGRPRRSVSTLSAVGYALSQDAGAVPVSPNAPPPRQQQQQPQRAAAAAAAGLHRPTTLAAAAGGMAAVGQSIRGWMMGGGGGIRLRRPSVWSTATSALSDVEDGSEDDDDGCNRGGGGAVAATAMQQQLQLHHTVEQQCQQQQDQLLRQVPSPLQPQQPLQPRDAAPGTSPHARSFRSSPHASSGADPSHAGLLPGSIASSPPGLMLAVNGTAAATVTAKPDSPGATAGFAAVVPSLASGSGGSNSLRSLQNDLPLAAVSVPAAPHPPLAPFAREMGSPTGPQQHTSWSTRRAARGVGRDGGGAGGGRLLAEPSSSAPAAAAVATTAAAGTPSLQQQMPSLPPREHHHQQQRVAPSPPAPRQEASARGARLSRLVQPLRQLIRSTSGGGRAAAATAPLPPPAVSPSQAPTMPVKAASVAQDGSDGGNVSSLSSPPTLGNEHATQQRRMAVAAASVLVTAATPDSGATSPRLLPNAISLPPIWASTVTTAFSSNSSSSRPSSPAAGAASK